MEDTNVVKDDLTNQQPSEGEQQVVDKKEVVTPAPGSKTDSELLLKSLKEEREKRREEEEKRKELEEEINNLKSSNLSEEVFSDEGKLIQKNFSDKVSILENEIKSLKDNSEMKDLVLQYPELKDKLEEFKEFRKTEHPKAKLDSVAKLFLVENGFLETPRKGLEKTTGGTRTPMASGMTADEIKTLRETNYKKYSEMLTKGQIKFEA